MTTPSDNPAAEALPPLAAGTDAAHNRARAILLMVLAILCFTLMDATAKTLAGRVGVIPTVWVRYAGHMAIVLVLVLPRLRSVTQTNYPGLQVLRSLLLMAATGLYFTGVARIPLSDAAALMSTNPVLITLGAALFLGEALGIRRIAGIAVALIGALIILRPGSAVFSPSALYPLGAAACYSGYALLTRKVGAGEDVWTSLFYTGLVGTVVLSAVVPFYWQSPDATAWALMAALACVGIVGQIFLIRAFSLGEASMLAPYSYLGLIFATTWGLIFFGELPDRWTILGALVIAAAGLYVWYRETYRRG